MLLAARALFVICMGSTVDALQDSIFNNIA